MRVRNESVAAKALLWAFFLVAMGFFLYPLWIGLVGSVKTTDQILRTKVYLPTLPFQFESYKKALGLLAKPLEASLALGLYVTAIAIGLGILGGYSLGLCRFKGRNLLIALCLFGIYIPPVTKMLPALKIAQWLGVYNTTFGVGLITGAMVMTTATIVFRQFYIQIPKTYLEAVTIEGGDHLHIMRYVILPMSVSPAISVFVMAFTIGWNNYMMALVLTQGPIESRPVALSIAILKDLALFEGDYSVMLAGGILAALPPILLYVLCQKYVQAGGARGGGTIDK